ncbi:MAG: glycogen debranching enzyme family protein [Chitinophagaceae bacterium]|nr:glycogen debranching enzyme family protein [Chitinophagaceae bacterium]
MLTKNRAVLQNFADATQHEWLETNGLGGWASSSIIGANTRRYHGLLTAAIVPPAERMVLLSKLDETIVTGDKRTELGVNLYQHNVIAPTGHHYLSHFTKELFPQWEYEVDGIKLRKTIAMVNGENTTLIIYDVPEANEPFTLELLPLMAARNYHSLTHEGPQMHWDVQFENGIFHNQPDGMNHVFISVPGANYEHSPRWFNFFQYFVEEYRGLDHTEDLFNHGTFSVQLKQGDSLGIIVSTEDPAGRNAHELFAKENMRRKLLVSNQPEDETVQQLVLAADQFIVKRNVPDSSSFGGGWEGATIIAGYHWFTDWGRDTMISLPGLCLSTGRYEDAKKILSAFAHSVSEGMLPNRFQDNGEAPEYNNVDGTLWYFIAVYKYLQATGDVQYVLNEILPVLKHIIDWHYIGTRYNIHVDENDGLLFAGEEGQQLTWMDARIGNWVVTPRMGKPVEVQALWYNALRIFSELLNLNGQEGDAIVVNVSAEKVKQNFEEKFWYAEGNYLYDNILPDGKPSAEFRPNQLFAISLPFALIEGDKARMILQMVEEQLYTPVGLKTLPKTDTHYVPVYGGDQYHRDAAYHEGTVWSWLLGPYVDAVVKTTSDRSKAQEVISNFKYHLEEACIGSVSEIFDAEPPHHPRGCIAQAWGVAEILRVIKDHHLYEATMEKVEPKMEMAEA